MSRDAGIFQPLLIALEFHIYSPPHSLVQTRAFGPSRMRNLSLIGRRPWMKAGSSARGDATIQIFLGYRRPKPFYVSLSLANRYERKCSYPLRLLAAPVTSPRATGTSQLFVDACGTQTCPMSNTSSATATVVVVAKLAAWMEYAQSEPRIIGFVSAVSWFWTSLSYCGLM